MAHCERTEVGFTLHRRNSHGCAQQIGHVVVIPVGVFLSLASDWVASMESGASMGLFNCPRRSSARCVGVVAAGHLGEEITGRPLKPFGP